MKKAIENLLKILNVDLNQLNYGTGKIILIGGSSCSGKSVLARNIIQKYPNYTILNTGDIFRKYAKLHSNNISNYIKNVQNTNQDLINLDKKVDKEIIVKLIETNKDIIITSRFAPVWGYLLTNINRNNLSIYLDVNETHHKIRFSKREFKNTNITKLNQTQNKTIQNELNRDKNDNSRYELIYNLNPQDYKKYSSIIDTNNITETDVSKIILDLINQKIEN
jgi:cytidylate kinase